LGAGCWIWRTLLFQISLWLVVIAMWVLLENKTSGQPKQSPPRGNRNRPIGPSTVPGRAHCPSGGGGGMISFSIFVVSGRTCPLYKSRAYSQFPTKIKADQ